MQLQGCILTVVLLYMQELLRIVLILSLSSTCLCHGLVNNEASKVLNVLNHGAVGDGETDDSQVNLSLFH